MILPAFELPMVPRDALVQAVVQGMVVALAFATVAFAAIGIITATYINRHIADMEGKILQSVRKDAATIMHRITANVLHRLGYFEWQQSHLPVLSADEQQKALQTAIIDTERAYALMKEAGVENKDDSYLLATIRNNLAWYYAEKKATDKSAEAIEHTFDAAANPATDDPQVQANFLLTKAFVLTVFARDCNEARAAVWTCDHIQSQYGHLPGITEKVAVRRPDAEAKVKQLCAAT